MLEELRNKLYFVEEKITEYNKEIEGSTKYMTAQIRIKEAEKELETADSQKRSWLNQDIRRWKNEVEEAKENISSKFDLKKKKLISDLKTKITEYCNAQEKVYEGLISNNKIEIDNLINLVANNNQIGNYKDVATMSQKIYDLSNLNIKYRKNLEKISNTLANIDNYNEINEFKSVIYDLSLFSNEKEEAKLDNKVSIKSITNTKDDVSNIDNSLVTNDTNSNESEIGSKNKDDVSNDTKSDFEDVYSDANDSVDLAKKALLVAREKRTKKSLKHAEELIDKVPQENLKTELSEEFDKLVSDITKEFMIKTYELYKYIKLVNIDTKDLFDRDKVEEVVLLYDALYNEEIPELNFKKEEYAKKVDEIVRAYNMQEQNNYKLNKEVTDKKPFSKFQILKEFRPLFITSIASKILAKRIERNAQKGNKDKVNKLLKKVKEIDIINSPRLFIFKNKLSKLKPKLYKGGIKGLDSEEKDNYNKYNGKISSIMLKKLIRVSNDDKVLSDKLRVKTVIGQWLELLSKCPEEVVISNEEYSKEDIFNKAIDFFSYANEVREFEDEKGTIKYQSITDAEYDAYVSEAEDIYNYHNKVDEFYEIPSENYEGILSSYEELNKLETPYYSNPMYYDEDKKNPVSYMKLSRRK